jgi:hypothetical protein
VGSEPFCSENYEVGVLQEEVKKLTDEKELLQQQARYTFHLSWEPVPDMCQYSITRVWIHSIPFGMNRGFHISG